MSPDSKLWSLNPSNNLLWLILRVNDPNIITSISCPSKNETHPSPQKTGIIIITHNTSHCGALLKSLNVYWACRQSRPISVKLRDKASVNFSNIRLEIWGEKWKAERSSTAFLTADEKHHQGSARCCTQAEAETMQTFLHPEPGED